MAAPAGPAAGPGDVSLTAWGGDGRGEGNDYPYGYHLLDRADTLAEAFGKRGGGWAGGVNETTLAAAQAYSLGFASWFNDQWKVEQQQQQQQQQQGTPGEEEAEHEQQPRIAWERAGTRSGLSKVPYVRDTRRSVGLGGFRLTSADVSADPAHGTIAACSGSGGSSGGSVYPQGNPFEGEAVALGDYEYFDLHRMSVGGGGCPYTDPLPALAPYFVPFRALTSDEVPNLLLAGKTMAQTFLANAATRFHPVEWATGAAAGAAATQFVVATGGAAGARREGGRGGAGGGAKIAAAVVTSTSELYESPRRMRRLRDAIRARHAPVEWRACPPPPPPLTTEAR